MVLSRLWVHIVRFHILSIDCAAYSWLHVTVTIRMEGRATEVCGDGRVRQPSACALKLSQTLVHLFGMLCRLSTLLSLAFLATPLSGFLLGLIFLNVELLSLSFHINWLAISVASNNFLFTAVLFISFLEKLLHLQSNFLL